MFSVDTIVLLYALVTWAIGFRAALWFSLGGKLVPVWELWAIALLLRLAVIGDHRCWLIFCYQKVFKVFVWW